MASEAPSTAPAAPTAAGATADASATATSATAQQDSKHNQGVWKLIVNADDLGYDARRDEGIMDAFEHGIVTSASLMANGSSASTAAKRAKEVGLPLGLHLNLTEGTPLTASTSLVAATTATNSGGDGARLMRGKFGFRKALEEGTVTVSDVAREIEAQLSWFEEVVGRQPHHVDGHQHVHVLPKVAPLLAKAMQSRSIACTRLPIETLSHFKLPPPRLEFYTQIVEQATAAATTFLACSVTAPTAFVGYGVMGADMTLANLQASLQHAMSSCSSSSSSSSSRVTTLELMCHPGLTATPSGLGCGGGVDDFALSKDREVELAMLKGKPQ